MNRKDIEEIIENIKSEPELRLSGLHTQTEMEYKSEVKDGVLIFIIAGILKLTDINNSRPSIRHPYRILKWGIENTPEPYPNLIKTLRVKNNLRWWFKIALVDIDPETKARHRAPFEESLVVKAFEWLFNEQQIPASDNLEAVDLIFQLLTEIERWEEDMTNKFLVNNPKEALETTKNSPNISIEEDQIKVITKTKYYYLSFPFDSKVIFCIRMIGSWLKKDKAWKIQRSEYNAELISYSIEMIKKSIEVEKNKTNNMNLEEEKAPIAGQHGPITVSLIKNDYHVCFRYNKSIVRLIKLIPNKQYNRSKRTWVIPISSRSELINFLWKVNERN